MKMMASMTSSFFQFSQRRFRGFALEELEESIGHSLQNQIERCQLSLGDADEAVLELDQELFEHGVLKMADNLVQVAEDLQLGRGLWEGKLLSFTGIDRLVLTRCVCLLVAPASCWCR